jgi:hypothetical protein
VLDNWEKHAGGILLVCAKASFEFEPDYYEEQTGKDPNEVVPEANYKIKLYTVLSAHRLNQTSIPPVLENAEPNWWDALEHLIKKILPEEECKWVKRAVKEYMSTSLN